MELHPCALEHPFLISPELYNEIKDKEEFKDTVFIPIDENYLAERRTVMSKKKDLEELYSLIGIPPKGKQTWFVGQDAYEEIKNNKGIVYVEFINSEGVYMIEFDPSKA